MSFMDKLPTVISCCFCCFLRAGTVMIALFSFRGDGECHPDNIGHYIPVGCSGLQQYRPPSVPNTNHILFLCPHKLCAGRVCANIFDGGYCYILRMSLKFLASQNLIV
ncbi:unnamed protein product [Leptidea sinapis]|uniref:Uncharacterized protein n=1 Tax=Leptidea sinapis TaxID=189913 RepID=A0A5E4QML8_9NEOP|nr:unnamed protein product [Leptidea sinapis]